MESLLVITFDEPGVARQTIGELRRLHADGALTVRTAAVLERQADGRFLVSGDTDNIGFRSTVSGGLIGALLGALAGPVGLLLGGAAGAMVGAASDADEAGASEFLLTTVASRVPPGASAVVADAKETLPEVLDAVVSRLGGKVIRRSHLEVEAELAAAEHAVRAAEEEAKRVMRDRRKAQGEETMGDRVIDLMIVRIHRLEARKGLLERQVLLNGGVDQLVAPGQRRSDGGIEHPFLDEEVCQEL